MFIRLLSRFGRTSLALMLGVAIVGCAGEVEPAKSDNTTGDEFELTEEEEATEEALN